MNPAQRCRDDDTECRECEKSTSSAALRIREVISQAVGLLMRQCRPDPDAASGFIVRPLSHSNTKVRDIAAQMTEGYIVELNNLNRHL